MKLTRTIRLLALLCFFLCIRELVDLYGHMTCWTGTETEGHVVIRLSKFPFQLLTLLTIFFAFMASNSLCVFFPKLAFPFAACLQGRFGVCDPGVIQKLERTAWLENTAWSKVRSVTGHTFEGFTTKNSSNRSLQRPESFSTTEESLKFPWHLTLLQLLVKTQPLVHVILQNTCNHHYNTNTNEAETTANQNREQNQTLEKTEPWKIMLMQMRSVYCLFPPNTSWEGSLVWH